MTSLFFLFLLFLIGVQSEQALTEAKNGQSDGNKERGRILNNRPIIGILSQKYYGDFGAYKHSHSYIAASYVKWIESAGGRVVPIFLDQDAIYYANLLSSINGVLFPGGGQNLSDSGYARTGKIIFDLASEMNLKGDYFPLWGTCLGFELLTILASDEKLILSPCKSQDQALPIVFESNIDLASTKMFHSLASNMKKIMQTKNVTINYHRWCLTRSDFKTNLAPNYQLLGVNKDKNGAEFVSMIESKRFPFYGVIFHPEKTMFEFVLKRNHRMIPHDADSILVSQYFANYFVNECRKNNHSFSNANKEREALIYNYDAKYTIEEENFEQMYFFRMKCSEENNEVEENGCLSDD